MRDLCGQGSVPFAKYKKVISAKILFGNYNTFLSQKDKLVNKTKFILKLSAKLEFLIIWPWHGKSKEGGIIGFSGN